MKSALWNHNRAEAIPIPAASARTRNPPGVRDVWVFIILDAFSFLLYFLVFMAARIENPVAFELGRQQLNPILGLTNTLILLTSSWFVVRAVAAARLLNADGVKKNLLAAMLLGVAFAVLKVIGYADHAAAGHAIMVNGLFGFFGYYYVLTGIHFLHVIVGTALLLVCFLKARSEATDESILRWIESGASFWHLVDMLWVVLFPMLYLLRGI